MRGQRIQSINDDIILDLAGVEQGTNKLSFSQSEPRSRIINFLNLYSKPRYFKSNFNAWRLRLGCFSNYYR